MKKALICHFGLIIAILMSILVCMYNLILAKMGLHFIIDILEFLWDDAIAFLLRLWILPIITIIMFIYVKKKIGN
jgi:hypothetical protein